MNQLEKQVEKSSPTPRPMPMFPGCDTCLMDLAASAAKMSAPRDPETAELAQSAAREVLETLRARERSSPEIANRMLARMKEITGVADPFAKYKDDELVLAQKAFSRIQPRLGTGLASAVTSAAIGNSLDFFRPAHEALAAVDDLWSRKPFFFHDDIGRLEQKLESRPGLVLYLTDNTGEIFFDTPLFTWISQKAKRTVLVVKGGPALNDLTRTELEKSGLKTRFSEVADTGIQGAGVDWDLVSPEFIRLFGEADLILAKGMANLETLYPRPFSSPAFFIFKVKCRPIQDYLNAPPESFWALWRDPVAPGP